jgi:hypothetical protein
LASSISPESVLNNAYQNAGLSVPATASDSTSVGSTDSNSGAESGVSATSQITAIERQGQLQAYLSSSVVLQVLQATGANIGAAPNLTTLINDMLQEVLGAYQAQTGST